MPQPHQCNEFFSKTLPIQKDVLQTHTEIQASLKRARDAFQWDLYR